jgi:hypothetical protein
VKVNPYEYVRNNFAGIATSADDLVITLTNYLLPVTDNLTFDYDTDQDVKSSLTAERLNYFKKHFLGDFDETYWGTSWAGAATDTEIADITLWIGTLFNTILQTPEYQLG